MRFYQMSRMKYAKTQLDLELKRNICFVDDVVIVDKKNGEFKIQFLTIEKGQPPSAYLCIFVEGSGFFTDYPEFFQELFKYTKESITTAQLCHLLTIYGFEDKSDVPSIKRN